MKTKEELKKIKKEVEALNKKLCELTDEELAQVTGGLSYPIEHGIVCDWNGMEKLWEHGFSNEMRS